MKRSSGDEENILDEEEFEEQSPVRHSVWLRMVALITVVFFIGVIILPVWNALNIKTPLTDLMMESLHLKKNVDSELFDAVVKIEVISPKPGSTVTVEQKSSTGFSVDNKGLIATNHHVIKDAHNITVTSADGRKYRAKKQASNPKCDLAVLKLEGSNIPAVSLNLNDYPQPGDMLTVIGNPMDVDKLVVKGELKQYVQVKDKPSAMLCIDVPIYPGNSGSPVFDADDRVVGVIFGSLRIEEDGEEKIYGLAIPIKEITALLE